MSQADPRDPKLLAMLEPWRHRNVRVICARCDRILGEVEAPHAELFAYVDHVLEKARRGSSRLRGIRPRRHIAKGEATMHNQFGIPINEMAGTLWWKCKCGADIQRNKVRLVPAFVRAAAAGAPLSL